jgi:hypothetical protein
MSHLSVVTIIAWAINVLFLLGAVVAVVLALIYLSRISSGVSRIADGIDKLSNKPDDLKREVEELKQ